MALLSATLCHRPVRGQELRTRRARPFRPLGRPLLALDLPLLLLSLLRATFCCATCYHPATRWRAVANRFEEGALRPGCRPGGRPAGSIAVRPTAISSSSDVCSLEPLLTVPIRSCCKWMRPMKPGRRVRAVRRPGLGRIMSPTAPGRLSFQVRPLQEDGRRFLPAAHGRSLTFHRPNGGQLVPHLQSARLDYNSLAASRPFGEKRRDRERAAERAEGGRLQRMPICEFFSGGNLVGPVNNARPTRGAQGVPT